MVANIAIPEYLQVQVAIAQQAFDLMAGMSVAESRAKRPAKELETESFVEATLSYSGSFEGYLSLQCSPAVAYAFTQKAMYIEAPVEFTNEVRDALGELINTIGGTLKSILPPDTRVSMPNVFLVSAVPNPDAASIRLSRIAFESEFGPFRLTLYEKVQNSSRT
jgi:CheY-specific phosphatase CheX